MCLWFLAWHFSHTCSPWIFSINLWGRHSYYPCCADEDLEARGGSVAARGCRVVTWQRQGFNASCPLTPPFIPFSLPYLASLKPAPTPQKRLLLHHEHIPWRQRVAEQRKVHALHTRPEISAIHMASTPIQRGPNLYFKPMHLSWVPEQNSHPRICMFHNTSNSAGSKLSLSTAPHPLSTLHSLSWSEIPSSTRQPCQNLENYPRHFFLPPHNFITTLPLCYFFWSVSSCLSPLLLPYSTYHEISLRQIQQPPKWSLCLQ